MKILAIDPSGNCTGYALMPDESHITEAGRVRAEDGTNWTALDRIDSMLPGIQKLLARLDFDEIVIEIPALQAFVPGNRGVANYGMAVGLVLARCRAIMPPEKIHAVRVDVWTEYVKKDTRAEWIRRLFPQYREVTDSGLDIADAIALCRWWHMKGQHGITIKPKRPTTSRKKPAPRRKPGAGTLFAAAT